MEEINQKKKKERKKGGNWISVANTSAKTGGYFPNMQHKQ
jgi:hypothetical protein